MVEPLPSPDVESLVSLLLSERTPQSMHPSTLDGFLTALAAGPTFVPATEWIGAIRADGGFGDADPREILQMIMARQASIGRSLASDPPKLDPIFRRHSDENEVDAADWCQGFVGGIAMRAEAWAPLIRSRRSALLAPILWCMPARLLDRYFPTTISLERRRALSYCVPYAAIRIYEYWRDRVQERDPIERLRLGRNEPCPCGSGLKYKKCCIELAQAA